MQWKRDSQPKPGADGHDGDAYTCHDADSSTKSVADNAHAMHMVLILRLNQMLMFTMVMPFMVLFSD